MIVVEQIILHGSLVHGNKYFFVPFAYKVRVGKEYYKRYGPCQQCFSVVKKEIPKSQRSQNKRRFLICPQIRQLMDNKGFDEVRRDDMTLFQIYSRRLFGQ